MRRELILSEALLAWLEIHLSDAPDLRRVRVLCGLKLPFDWMPGFKKYIGLTLWNRIYLREPFELDSSFAQELLFHELVHVRQFNKNPILFPLKYLFYLAAKGYRNHPAEIEARKEAAELARRAAFPSAFL